VQIDSLKAVAIGSLVFLFATHAEAQWYDSYQDLTSIYGRLDEFQTSYPDLVSSFSIGDSYEGREIRGIRISGTGGTQSNRLCSMAPSMHANGFRR